jgi:hypothetical protein
MLTTAKLWHTSFGPHTNLSWNIITHYQSQIWFSYPYNYYALIIIPLFITQAPTCFGTYVPASGSILYPCELLESPKWLCHRDVPLHCKCWWPVCTGCCSWCAQLDKVTHETTTSCAHRPATFTVQGYIPMRQPFRTFKYIKRIKDIPWRRHVSAGTCRSLNNKRRNNNQCIVLVCYTQSSNAWYGH